MIRNVQRDAFFYIERGIDYTGNKDEKLEIYNYSTESLFIRTQEIKNKAAITCREDASVYILGGKVFIRGAIQIDMTPAPLAITGKLIIGSAGGKPFTSAVTRLV